MVYFYHAFITQSLSSLLELFAIGRACNTLPRVFLLCLVMRRHSFMFHLAVCLRLAFIIHVVHVKKNVM